MNGTDTLAIKRLWRSGAHVQEELSFEFGVNVIVGQPNTGKTKWLQILDYILADSGKAEDAFGSTIAEKYDHAGATIVINGTSIELERRWKEPGLRTKVFVNGENMAVEDCQTFLVNALRIPRIKFPQGNPMSPKPWVELTFRSLLRHFYRQQDYWNDLADQQPVVDQHACLLQFCGIADKIFPNQTRVLHEKQKEVIRLQERKDQFLNVLNQIARDVLTDHGAKVAITPESIHDAIEREEKHRKDLEAQRRAMILEFASDKENSGGNLSKQFQELSERRVSTQTELEDLQTQRAEAESRRSEMDAFLASLDAECRRLERAQFSGETLSPFKVSHCPNCDQPIRRSQIESGENCYVCLQSLPRLSLPEDAKARLNFEMLQLQAERNEAEELRSKLTEDLLQLEAQCRLRRELLQELAVRMAPYRDPNSYSPEISEIDIRIGQHSARQEQLERIKNVFESRDDVTASIETLEAEISTLLNEPEEQESISFERPNDYMTDGFNNYLNALMKLKHGSWTKGDVVFRLARKKFDIKVGGKHWKDELGKTLELYFLLAYHYALMTLTPNESMHYPGLLILDLVPEVEGASVADKENFILEPFVELLGRPPFKHSQVIMTGSAFTDLEGVNRIELSHVW